MTDTPYTAESAEHAEKDISVVQEKGMTNTTYILKPADPDRTNFSAVSVSSAV